MKLIHKLIPFWLSVCMMMLLPTAHAADEAVELLERMNHAARTLNYQGVFSYQAGRNLQSIKIYHRADEDGELERLIALNGPAREVIRTNDKVTCINPEGRQINISPRPLGSGFPSDLPRKVSSALPYYELSFQGESRVAGRNARELLISPVDEYRYGYRLWVDTETDLLLKTQLLATDGEVLEMFAFSSIQTDVEIGDEKLQSRLDGDEMVLNRTDKQSSSDIEQQSRLSRWDVTWLPEGFSLVALQTRLRASNGAEVEQRVYSDGMSSVSVFIEKILSKHRHLQGATQMGGINAYGNIIHSHFITVVGEVPGRTVEKIGASIQFVDLDQP